MDKAPTKHVQVSLGVLELIPETLAHRRSKRSVFILLNAAVCEQRLGGFLRLLLTAGVCEQRFCLPGHQTFTHCRYMRPAFRRSP